MSRCTLKIEWLSMEETRTFKVAGLTLAGASSNEYCWFWSESKTITHEAILGASGSKKYPVAWMAMNSVIYWPKFDRAEAERLIKRQPNDHRRYSIHEGPVPKPPIQKALCVGDNLRGRPDLDIEGHPDLESHRSDSLKLGDEISFTVKEHTNRRITFDRLKVHRNIIDAPLKGRSNSHIKVKGSTLYWVDQYRVEMGRAMARAYADQIKAAGYKWVIADHQWLLAQSPVWQLRFFEEIRSGEFDGVKAEIVHLISKMPVPATTKPTKRTPPMKEAA